jgi:hypothetical protein
MKALAAAWLACCAACSPAAAQDGLSFQGKTITMIIGFAAGGGTDAYGRLVAGFLGGYLPGAPTVVVRNIPGADGITGMNYFVQQVVPDGTTIAMAASTSADPLNYRKAAAHFDPTTFAVVGGVVRGGEAMLINIDAERRLHDKGTAPVIMGALGGVPRSGMQMTAWGIEVLGWNAKWVIGYRGTNELMLALERGEIDMTSTANLFLIQKLIATSRFKILVQTGTFKNGALAPRPDFGGAPIFATLMEGRIADPVAQKAFEYWSGVAVMDKWLALPPKSAKAMLDAYRDAYGKVVVDRGFVERGKAISDDISPLPAGDVETLIRRLGGTPREALEYITAMLKKQGLPTE